MISGDSILVSLVRMVDHLPFPPPPARRKRGRQQTYSDRLIVKAVVVMIIRRLYTAWALLAFLQQEDPVVAATAPPADRARAVSDAPHLGAALGRAARDVAGLDWPPGPPPGDGAQSLGAARARGRLRQYGRAGARRASGTRKIGRRAWCPIPRLIPKRTGASRAGTGGGMAGSCTWRCPSAASGFPWPPSSPLANVADSEVAPRLFTQLPAEVRYVLGDQHYNTPDLRAECAPPQPRIGSDPPGSLSPYRWRGRSPPGVS